MDQLQPIILAAGRGSRMNALLGTSVVKCLLPVAGHPLLFYPLQSLALNGFAKHGVVVVVQEDHRDEVKRATDKIGEKLGIHIDLFTVSEDHEDFGPCESIRELLTAKKITRDVLIMSCDTISNGSLRTLVNFHQSQESDCTAFFLNHLPIPAARLPGPKSKSKPEKDILGINPETSELLFLASEADFEEHITFPLAALRHCLNVKLYTSFIDSHIYIIRKTILEEHLLTSKNFVSLKGEFLPHLISKFNDEETSTKIKSFAFMDPTKECIRINTMLSYAVVNKCVDWVRKSFGLERNTDREQGLKGAVKLQSTVVGDSCVFGDKVKIVNSLLMDSVEVGSGALLENCIVSTGAKIGPNCVLKECLVGPNFTVPEGGRFTNESLTVADDTFFEA